MTEMTDQDQFRPGAAIDPPAAKKPCIALMGEFSAGKSTLSNLLIGQTPLPVKVTATQLPPVRISHGNGPGWREDRDGTVRPVDLEDLADISPAETRLVQLFVEADLLRLCDLIDMPGISDPNMDSGVWEDVIDLADGVIWCSHATQAWRQSEAAVWDGLADRLACTSLLLLTRSDKLVTDQDKARVIKRVSRETEGLFKEVLPISLTDAVAGRNDWDRWTASGAEAFSQAFITLLNALQPGGGDLPARAPAAPTNAAPAPNADTAPLRLEDALPPDPADPGAVRPRRVTVDRDRSRGRRPTAEEAKASRPF
ncbi:Dynamin family protein [Rhodovulum sp. ES.010]|uniref:dynamin family protein n=1 Tax=Rhodovulum sp. ES.010 TaxID=1882821 RepID=UPI0009287E32|nr:dynamin family protein [Rhodovulum sp. ES.010]SIO40634.1 Dynamin family protein [Rhodovulum sp. ES.010]